MSFIKKVFRRVVRVALKTAPFSLLIRMHGKKLILPLYHTVSDERLPHVIHLFNYCNVKEFEKDLDFFQKYFTPVSISDLIDSIYRKSDLPYKSFLLSFDDGHREVYETVAPILKRRSIPAALFLNTAFIDNRNMSFRYKACLVVEKLQTTERLDVIERLSALFQIRETNISGIKTALLGVDYKNRRLIDEAAHLVDIDFNNYLVERRPYLSTCEIKELTNQGFTIGAHSVDHPLFRELTTDEQLEQTNRCLDKLREQFNIRHNIFAFPFTDKGVKEEFFDKTHQSGVIDVSFGTSDFSIGYCFNNLQRQPMEGRTYHAKNIYRGLFIQEILRRWNLLPDTFTSNPLY